VILYDHGTSAFAVVQFSIRHILCEPQQLVTPTRRMLQPFSQDLCKHHYSCIHHYACIKIEWQNMGSVVLISVERGEM
jgi:hypothetical protein